MPATPLPLSTPSRNLVRLTIVRGITWTGFLMATVFGLEILGFELRAAAVIGVIVCMGLVNLFTWWRLGRQWAVSDMEYLLHLLVDVIGLTLLFYLTGGCNNPFISYFLVPVTIAAATLPWHYAWIVAPVSIAAYTLLQLLYYPVPPFADLFYAATPHPHVLRWW